VVNPFFTRAKKGESQPKSYWRSKNQEKDLSKRLGGRPITGSGSGIRKGDVRVSGIARIEAKTTLNASFRVTLEMVEKISNAAINNDEMPAIIVEFLDPHGKPKCEVAIVPVAMLEGLIHVAKTNAVKRG